jgi:hypothetical protein
MQFSDAAPYAPKWAPRCDARAGISMENGLTVVMVVAIAVSARAFAQDVAAEPSGGS